MSVRGGALVAWAGAALAIGCGASPHALAPAVATAPAPETRADDETRAVETEAGELSSDTRIARAGGVDVFADVATVDIERPAPSGAQHCLIAFQHGRAYGWSCGEPPPGDLEHLNPSHADQLEAHLRAVEDWGSPATDDASRSPGVSSRITLGSGRSSVARFALAPAGSAQAAFVEAAMQAANEALAQLRAAPEACDRCPDTDYCAEGWECSSLMDHSKNCAPTIDCRPRLPPSARCTHNHECRSRSCAGSASTVGSCA